MMRRSFAGLAVLALAAVPGSAFEFKDGDKVVLIGSTLIEREQRYGYWEAAITARNPDKNITFRNLGWSGDTVWGEARAGFGTPAEGYKHLIDHVKAEKPTVIIVGYGTNESFAGPEGLPKFKEQLKKLLDDLAPTKARFVLLSTLPIINRTSARLAPSNATDNLKLYSGAVGEEARARKAKFVDLWEVLRTMELMSDGPPKEIWTDNGSHLNALGYSVFGLWMVNALIPELAEHKKLYQQRNVTIEINLESGKTECTGTSLMLDRKSPLRFRGTPSCVQVFRSIGVERADGQLRIRGLKAGDYRLTIDGKPSLFYRKADDLLEAKEGSVNGVYFIIPDGLEQFEKLRRAIIAKNELYFHRWRPQNVTYLFGFRKHEQGNNAREIPQFDPLIEAKEKEIAKLRVPREHVYELVPVKEEKK